MGAGGPATHSVASVVATLEVEGSELLRPLPLVRRWRTKQNLDYCFLMMYAQSKGIYYVQVSTDALLWLPFPLPGPGWRALPSLCPSLVLAPFYLATTVQLEDDIIAKPNYLSTIPSPYLPGSSSAPTSFRHRKFNSCEMPTMSGPCVP